MMTRLPMLYNMFGSSYIENFAYLLFVVLVTRAACPASNYVAHVVCSTSICSLIGHMSSSTFCSFSCSPISNNY
ncbi:hypothetical protein L6452_31199 [Arctium lappa]|uniref:Uncharacterized protein n=1 Tax=Arctium lappa TaxID=4217 RepID=A0ACB8ZJT5_ARCLA|nr:hypothetical protein L6452_31199 [Arctium lappa]